MRALILGGSGLIGSAVAKRLTDGGHEVLLASRQQNGNRSRLLDLTRLDADALNAAVENIDVVVNCAGIFVEQGKQSFDAIHVKGPAALYEAARASGVRSVIQVSALGADSASRVAYFASKGRGDEHLLRLKIQAWVVRPSLVYSPQGSSTRFFARLAALPVTPLPGGGTQQIQPIHLDDLADVIVALALAETGGGILNAVGPRAISLREYLLLFKSAFGIAGRFAAVPAWMARAGARLVRKRTGQLISTDSLKMLEASITTSASLATSILGRPLRDPKNFFDNVDPRVRIDAQLGWLLPLMRIAISLMWLVTAWVSAFVYPLPLSLHLLAGVGLHGPVALVALYGAAALDAALGAALLVMRRRRPIYLLQLATVLAYTILITIFLPEYWWHPYGPVLKNVPLMAMISALLYLDRDDGPDSP
jgi:uncharacterized protein YbjT (DUF2867 family)